MPEPSDAEPSDAEPLDVVLRRSPVAWSDPRVRALFDATTNAVPYVTDIQPIVAAVDLSLADLPTGPGATGRLVWRAAFDVAATRLRVPQLVAEIVASRPAVGQRLDDLRRPEPALPRGPGEPPGEKAYRGFSSEARQERQIVATMPTLLDVRFLALGVERARSVCRIEAGFATSTSLGTGFRIGARRILTNHHVVFDEQRGDAPARTVQVQFGKELRVDGTPATPVTINGLAGDGLRGERADDWAVVELVEPPPADAGILSIAGPTTPVAVDDRVTIVQHPRGLDKKIGLTHNLVRWADDTVIQYWTDTDEGSSGAPVFNENWEVVALHHASVPVGTEDQYGYRNQGRSIARIAARVHQIVG